MTLDEILSSLFPQGHDVGNDRGLVRGSGALSGGGRIQVLGVVDRTPIGVDEALQLSDWVLDVIAQGGSDPILIMVDSDSQRMSKREELLGLNEYLAHLAKALIHADLQGHATVGLLFGHTAAGAFIATALATRTLVALPGAQPEVMDLPSMSRVTKLPIEVLKEKARSTPVFAPGLENLAQTGAVLATWERTRSLAEQLQGLLDEGRAHYDQRDALGMIRDGRPKAADIQERVRELALQAQ
jgi:malonate decarboxylase gamma subunit